MFVDVDVRPILRAGGEPFGAIMQALDALKPHQGLRLFAPFKPMPLFGVMESRGFTCEAKELDGGEWEVLFCPSTGDTAERPGTAAGADDEIWPAPVTQLDNRELDPPEPMVRILAATETLRVGEVLSALLCREPIFLFPELRKRGHQWRGEFDADGFTYRLLGRTSTAGRSAA
jgi:uncharacterized protein (DUF2249 family)